MRQTLFSTLAPLGSAVGFEAVSPPGPPGPLPPFGCQDSCSLGATGIQEWTDVDGCVALGQELNVSRDRCCAACTDAAECQAFAYGRDDADPAHRHTCFLCKGLKGTRPSADRDFGCVARLPATTAPNFVLDQAAPEFYGTYGAFTSDPAETIIGLGQHSAVTGPGCDGTDGKCGQWKLNNKGFTWPLEITKFQITVPFYVSSRQYGFLWNHPGDGTVAVGNTSIEWTSVMQKQVDFWVTAAPANCGTSPYASIMSSYVDATGHAPVLPGWATGFWQSKMRYRTTDELLDINSGYKSRNINLSVIVIDFYSWPKFGVRYGSFDVRFDRSKRTSKPRPRRTHGARCALLGAMHTAC